MKRTRLTTLSLCLLTLAACDDDKKNAPATDTPAATASTPSSASAKTTLAPAPSGSATDTPVPPGDARYVVATGKGTFLIEAPLEKIKGQSDEVRGHIDVNLKDLGKSTGEIMVRLSTLKTNTFDDSDKNVAQTEHARNWMEVGNDSSAESRMKYEWATLTITSIDPTPAALDAAKDGTVKAKVSGDLLLHGITSKETMPVTVTFKGPATAPTEVSLKTDQPMTVSMKEHDVKPRDKVGGFLNGALERIGKKIDDKVQVSFEAVAKSSMPAAP